MSLKTISIAAAVVLGLGLTACSGSDSGDGDGDQKAYCERLESSAADVQALANGDLSGLEQAFSTAHQLAEDAPPAVRDQWKTIDGAVVAVQKAFKDAGLTMAEVEQIQSGGEIPESVDITQMGELGKIYSDISGPKFEAAQKKIVTHAKDVCGVDVNAA